MIWSCVVFCCSFGFFCVGSDFEVDGVFGDLEIMEIKEYFMCFDC